MSKKAHFIEFLYKCSHNIKGKQLQKCTKSVQVIFVFQHGITTFAIIN